MLKKALDKGMKLETVYGLNDLVKSDALFVATGVSPSPILKGVAFERDEIITHSVVMESESRLYRLIESHYGI